MQNNECSFIPIRIQDKLLKLTILFSFLQYTHIKETQNPFQKQKTILLSGYFAVWGSRYIS